MSTNIDYSNVIKEFISDITISDDNDKTNENIAIDKFYEYSQIINKDMFSFSYDDFVSMFNYYPWTNKLSSFHNRKSIIRRFLDYAKENGYCSAQYVNDFKNRLKAEDMCTNSYYQVEYFENFEELHDLIEGIKANIPLEEIDKRQMQIAVVYLTWVGFTLEEIINIRENDFNYETGEIKSELTGRTFIIKDQPIKTALLNAMEVEGISYPVKIKGKEAYREVTKVYEKTGYIIKTFSKKDTSKEILRCMFSNISKLPSQCFEITDEKYSRKITFTGVYLSGLYNRIRDIENALNLEISYKEIDVFDKELNGALLNGKDDKSAIIKAQKMIREYLQYKKYLSTKG